MITIAEKRVQQRSIESREKLNAAAWKLFCEKGYYNTNTKEIAKTAGISVGNFYNYYKDKADIYYELSKQYLHGSAEAIITLKDALLQAEDQREALKKYIDIQMDRATNTAYFFSNTSVMVQQDDRLRKLFEDATNEVIHSIELLLTEIPGVKKRASYPVMARLLFTMVDKLSEDVCSQVNAGIYEEYREQMTEIIQNYAFGEL